MIPGYLWHPYEGHVTLVAKLLMLSTSLLALRGSSLVIYSFLTVSSSAVAHTLHNDERLSFPHIVLASTSLSCPFTVASFSLIPLSSVPRRADRAPYRPKDPCGYPSALPFSVRFLDSVRLEDMITPLNSARSLA
jgi:hypothetical protein